MLNMTHPFLRLYKAFLIAFILAFSLSACGYKLVPVDQGAGLTPEVYEPIPPYSDPIDSVGTLTEGYIQNTTSLITVNSRLVTLCEAYLVCNPKKLK